MDNSSLRQSSLLYAATASAIIVLTSLGVKGVWTISDLSLILWLFWLGAAAGQLFKKPKWIRAVSLLCGLAIVGTTAFPTLDYVTFFHPWNRAFWGYVLLGFSVPKDYKAEGRNCLELTALCVVFVLMYVTCAFAVSRIINEGGVFNGDEILSHLWKVLAAVEVIPLLAFLYYFFQFTISKDIQRILSNKVIKWICIILCTAAFIFAVTEFIRVPSGLWNLTKLLLCPFSAYVVVLAVSGIQILVKKMMMPRALKYSSDRMSAGENTYAIWPAVETLRKAVKHLAIRK